MEVKQGMLHHFISKGLIPFFINSYLVTFFLALACMLSSQTSQAGIQRWVDEKGAVHYGDKIPPEYAGKGSIELNQQGIRVKERSRNLTDQERESISKEQREQQEANRSRQEQQRRDKSLLDTYANADEIKRARSRILESIDGAIHVTELRLEEIAKQKNSLDQQLQKKLSQDVFSKLSAERESLLSEIRHLNDIVLKRKTERQQTDQKYGADLQRYEEITKSIRTSTNNRTGTTPAPVVPNGGSYIGSDR